MKPALRLGVILCALAATAVAAPKHPRASKLDPALSDHVKAAEQAWTAAENEQSAVLQPEAWEAAAKAFAAVDGDAVDANVKLAAARAAVLAWENQIEGDPAIKPPGSPRPKHDTSTSNPQPQPVPVPPREQAMIAAFDRFLRYATAPSDPDVPVVTYFEAVVYSRFDQLEPAIKLYRAILDHHRTHAVAGDAAGLLLDAYNRLGRFDDLVALAGELAKDTAFLDGKTDLKATVMKIQRQGRRRNAEALERAAKDTHDLDKYLAAAHAYLDLYNSDPKSNEGDELLYNAGVLFEEGKAFGAALGTFAMEAKSFGSSRLTGKAIARQARIYEDIAMFDKAADKLEEYAKTYAGEKDAYDALSDAVYYRKALGDRDKAIADANLFVKLFGARKPSEAAAAMWSITSLLEAEPARMLAHLRGYVKTFGSKGGSDRLVIAYAKIGQVLWKQSCPVAGFDGLCVKTNPLAPRNCGKGTTRTFATVARNAVTSKEALASFAAAIRELERSHIDDATARYYFAQAKLALADAALEPSLGLPFPKLDFGDGSPAQRAKKDRSMKQFNGWLDAKKTGGATANRQYEAVLAIKDAATELAAAERIAIVSESFASALVTGVLPVDIVRDDSHTGGASPAEKQAAYCEAMANAAEPLEGQSKEALTVCLAKSTELGWFDDSSRICEQELVRIDPVVFPAAKERRIEPILTTPVIALEPPTGY